MPTTPTDATKAERDRQFQAEALCWLPDVSRYALSLTHDESDADDLAQDTFLRAYEAWHTYTPGTECRGWLFTICRHTFLRTRSREERRVETDDAELEALAAAGVHASAREGGYADLFTRFDLSRAIERAIAELPEVHREVVVLVDVNDVSYEDAAATLGVPIGTIRSRLFRARRVLQERLIEYARDAGLVKPPGSSAQEGASS